MKNKSNLPRHEVVVVRALATEGPSGWSAVASDAHSYKTIALGFGHIENVALLNARKNAAGRLKERGYRYGGKTDVGNPIYVRDQSVGRVTARNPEST